MIHDHSCDICGSDEAAEIAVARRYTAGQPIHVCCNCGFVYVRRRRSAEEIARAWSEEVFRSHGIARGYTAKVPYVKARHVYVAEYINSTIGLRGKDVCDIGGGEGQFLEMIRQLEYGAEPFAVEPSSENCAAMTASGIPTYHGTIEKFSAAPEGKVRKFDIVTIMWTLENCHSCRAMLQAAHDVLKPEGYVVIATGSRIFVPFKKPLHYYLSKNPADTHPFRFSVRTLEGALVSSGFAKAHVNRYIDGDFLVMIGRKAAPAETADWVKDDWRAVQNFFDRWDADTQAYYRDA